MNAQRQNVVQAHSRFTPVPSGLLQRECACGNHTVGGGECRECRKRGLQTKLKVNEPRDIYEQEADRIADQVLTAPRHPGASGAAPRIQRFSGQSTGQMDAVPASVDQALASPGRPLEPTLRQDMEQRFGYDFSRVRVHSDAAAEQSAQDVNAHAYTVGHSVMFGAGQFAPGTHQGRQSVAHELTHVVQQSGAERNGPSIVQRSPAKEPECPGYEQQEVEESHTEKGILSENVRWPGRGQIPLNPALYGPTDYDLLIADFGADWRHPKKSVKDDPVLKRFKQTYNDPSYILTFRGYSDCVGTERENSYLRNTRAQFTQALFSDSKASTGNTSARGGSYVADNSTSVGRAYNRSVAVSVSQIVAPAVRLSVPPKTEAGKLKGLKPLEVEDCYQHEQKVRLAFELAARMAAAARYFFADAVDNPKLPSFLIEDYFGYDAHQRLEEIRRNFFEIWSSLVYPWKRPDITCAEGGATEVMLGVVGISCGPNTLAWAVPAVGHTIHFCSPSFKQSPVDLCELAETIVHESAHLAISAGAFVIHEPYYQQGKWKEIYSTDKLIKTADSYSSFSVALYKQKYPGSCPKAL